MWQQFELPKFNFVRYACGCSFLIDSARFHFDDAGRKDSRIVSPKPRTHNAIDNVTLGAVLSVAAGAEATLEN